jgi:hypothetical protein
MKTPVWMPTALAAAAGLLLSSCMSSTAVSPGAPTAQTPTPEAGASADTLPIYDVTQSGANAAQIKGLYESLGLPRHRLAEWRNVMSYVDPTVYLAIPSRPVTDPAHLEKLREMTRREPEGASIQFEAIDFDAVRKLTVYDSDAALKAAAAAFAAAGLHLESATPAVSHTVFTASYTDDNGAEVSVNQRLDTKVNYRFAGRNGIPFTGPGAQLQVTYDAKGKVSQFYYAWREVKEGEAVKVIPEAEARERIAKLLPARAKIDLRLVYWCPPFDNAAARGKALEPVNILPWYSFTATIETRDSASGRVSEMKTKERLIPATDDRRYVPVVDRFDVAGSGGTRVEASLGVTGGRAPYTFVWTGSNPEVLANRTREVSYVPMARAVPSPGATFRPTETVDVNETISVTAIDANGVAALATQTIPVHAQPIIPRSHGGSHGGASFGCESPAEPEEWVQERVGWQEGMSNPGAGTQSFCWLGDDSWPGDYIKPSPAGSLPASPWIYGDADYSNWGINTANLVLVNGDGWADGFTAMFPGAPESDYNNDVDLYRPGNPGGTVLMPTTTYSVNYNGSWGTAGPDDRLYWLVGLLCDCLDETDGDGLSPHQRWGAAFGGLHIFTGFSSEAAYSAGAFPKAFAENILGVSGSPQTIKDAWFNASTSTNEGTAAAMGPITTGAVSDLGDYYVGKGSRGPSIAPANITGWWYLHQ